MELKQPENNNQINDWNAWCPGAVVGEVIDTPLNPVLFSRLSTEQHQNLKDMSLKTNN
jgi:hypothetical protein